MSFKLEIELDLLRNQAVAEALAQFMRALGTQSQAAMMRPSIPGVSIELDMTESEAEMGSHAQDTSEQWTQAVSCAAESAQPGEMDPAPQAATVDECAASAGARAETVQESDAEPQVQLPALPRRLTSRERHQQKIEGMDLKARYRMFLEQLPEKARAFLDLVRQKGSVSIDEAMEQLGVKVGKAMGGLTGAISRWAPAFQVNMPYQACSVDGLRIWRWLGSPLDNELALEDAAQAKPLPMSMLLDVTIELPATSQTFLKHLESEGRLSTKALLRLFKLKSEQSLKGILEPIDRLVQEHALTQLYKTEVGANGEVTYLWP